MPSPSDPRAESLFGSWLERHEAGEAEEFEALCRAHSEQAEALRELHSRWTEIRRALQDMGRAPSIAEELESLYGAGTFPDVTLGGEAPPSSSATVEIVSRLADRTPGSTRYQVQGEVAHGGMGAVLRVWDMDLRRPLAMKVMLGQGLPQRTGETPRVPSRGLSRFLEEAQVTGQLDHPGIVPVHELGLDRAGRVFFTMKLVQGRTLRQVFDELERGEGGWTQTRVLGLVLKVCEAMSYAHAKGVIHRDLKPANVMVGAFGEVYVMDWGLAKVLDREAGKDIRLRPASEDAAPREPEPGGDDGERDDSLVTLEGEIVGTPAYMPPEQARGDLDAMGPHSDVYAVGAILYHLLSGRVPYQPRGQRSPNLAVWRRVQEGPPTPLTELAPAAPAELLALCEKAMAREPRERYPDMSALARDLSAFLEGRVVGAYESGAWAEARKWVRRNRPLAAALGAAVLLLLVGLVSSLVLKAQSDAHAARADAEAAEAEAQRDLARAETAKVLRLSDVRVLQELVEEVDRLWPAHPDRVDALEAWLVRAGALSANLPGHRATLEQLRARALPWSDEERAVDRATHPLADELAARRAELDELGARLDEAPADGEAGDAQRDQLAQRAAELQAEVTRLADSLGERRTWSFEADEDRWQHALLAELVEGVERLDAELLAVEAISDAHGWSVPRRLAFARELQQGFAPGGRYALAWGQALPAIAAAYPGLELRPQMGLLPLGPDPASGLWEFVHLMTGEPPARDADGRLRIAEASGVVLVLLPGGEWWMGAQKDDPAAPNYDPQALGNEGRVRRVRTSAFLLAKHEMTQAQWLRLTGGNPSFYQRHEWSPTLLHPVEGISWTDCMTWLPRADLTLPSEAQWEYGARAGTQTPWCSGAEKESLQGAANLIDGYAHANGGAHWFRHEMWMDDGSTGHAEVGRYRANAFGLHDVVGNVTEWCIDGLPSAVYGRGRDDEGMPDGTLDPVSPWEDAPNRVARGGSFIQASLWSRSAFRAQAAPTHGGSYNGVRPSRPLER